MIPNKNIIIISSIKVIPPKIVTRNMWTRMRQLFRDAYSKTSSSVLSSPSATSVPSQRFSSNLQVEENNKITFIDESLGEERHLVVYKSEKDLEQLLRDYKDYLKPDQIKMLSHPLLVEEKKTNSGIIHKTIVAVFTGTNTFLKQTNYPLGSAKFNLSDNEISDLVSKNLPIPQQNIVFINPRPLPSDIITFIEKRDFTIRARAFSEKIINQLLETERNRLLPPKPTKPKRIRLLILKGMQQRKNNCGKNITLV